MGRPKMLFDLTALIAEHALEPSEASAAAPAMLMREVVI
jgi:hypothetical protein